MDYKIVNQSLYLCDRIGNIGRRIAESVSFGTFDDKTSTFLITKMDGKVELRDTNGNLKRTLINDSIEARFSGDEIIVRKKDGRTCLIDKVGNIKRYI